MEEKRFIMNLKCILNTIISASMTIAMTVSLCACGNQTSTAPSGTAEQDTTAAQTESVSREHRKIIIDTDTGADDASALILAAQAGEC